MLRRLVVIGALALVVVLGVSTGLSDVATGSVAQGATTASQATVGDSDHAQRPCVARADCAGASVLIGTALLLVLPAVIRWASPALLPASLPATPRPLRSALLAGKLYRPPGAPDHLNPGASC